MPDAYLLKITPAAFAYVRQALGRCPCDEVLPLILELEQQRAEQDRAAGEPPAESPQPAAVSNIVWARKARKPKGEVRADNGVAPHTSEKEASP